MTFPAALPAAALLGDYQRVREQLQRAENSPWRLPEMKLGRFETVLSQTFTQAADAWAALQALSVANGWVQWQSAQRASLDGLPAAQPEDGLLQQAQLVLTDGRSAAVQRRPDGHWQLSVIAHHDSGDLLCDLVEHLASARPLGKLRYRRYWQPDARRGVVQIAAHFIGFVPEE